MCGKFRKRAMLDNINTCQRLLGPMEGLGRYRHSESHNAVQCSIITYTQTTNCINSVLLSTWNHLHFICTPSDWARQTQRETEINSAVRLEKQSAASRDARYYCSNTSQRPTSLVASSCCCMELQYIRHTCRHAHTQAVVGWLVGRFTTSSSHRPHAHVIRLLEADRSTQFPVIETSHRCSSSTEWVQSEIKAGVEYCSLPDVVTIAATSDINSRELRFILL